MAAKRGIWSKPLLECYQPLMSAPKPPSRNKDIRNLPVIHRINLLARVRTIQRQQPFTKWPGQFVIRPGVLVPDFHFRQIAFNDAEATIRDCTVERGHGR